MAHLAVRIRHTRGSRVGGTPEESLEGLLAIRFAAPAATPTPRFTISQAAVRSGRFITSSRLIEINRARLGGFDMRDYQWKDLRDATMAENIIPNVFGAKLELISRAGARNITIDGLPSAIASTIYSHAQAQEQEWEEKNRIRDLEEKRASSGASVLNVGGYGNQRQDDGDMFVQLEKAKRLFDTGAISDAEYQELKAKMISKGG